MVINIVKLENSMSMGILLPSFCYEVSSLIRSNAVCNTMMVDKVFSFMNGSMGRSFTPGKINSYIEFLFQLEQNSALSLIEAVHLLPPACLLLGS